MIRTDEDVRDAYRRLAEAEKVVRSRPFTEVESEAFDALVAELRAYKPDQPLPGLGERIAGLS